MYPAEALREAALETNEPVRLTVQSQALWGMNKRPEADATLALLIDGYAELAARVVVIPTRARGQKRLR